MSEDFSLWILGTRLGPAVSKVFGIVNSAAVDILEQNAVLHLLGGVECTCLRSGNAELFGLFTDQIILFLVDPQSHESSCQIYMRLCLSSPAWGSTCLSGPIHEVDGLSCGLTRPPPSY